MDERGRWRWWLLGGVAAWLAWSVIRGLRRMTIGPDTQTVAQRIRDITTEVDRSLARQRAAPGAPQHAWWAFWRRS